MQSLMNSEKSKSSVSLAESSTPRRDAVFAAAVSVLILLAIGVAAVTLVAAHQAGGSVAAWPFFALAAFALTESRLLVDTPSLTEALQANPSVRVRSPKLPTA